MHCLPIEHVAQARAFYWLIEEACERLNAREHREHFAPDVYAALLRGEAKAVVVMDGEQPVGLYVACRDCEHNARPAMLIWLGYVRPGAPHGVAKAGLAHCEQLAAAEGLDTVVFGTQRRGWLRHARQLGFELVEYRYEKRVQA